MELRNKRSRAKNVITKIAEQVNVTYIGGRECFLILNPELDYLPSHRHSGADMLSLHTQLMKGRNFMVRNRGHTPCRQLDPKGDKEKSRSKHAQFTLVKLTYQKAFSYPGNERVSKEAERG